MTPTRKAVTATGAALAVASGIGYYMSLEESAELRLSGRMTNLLELVEVNPAFTASRTVLIHGDGYNLSTVGTNPVEVTGQVFCTNAFVLSWPTLADKCYDVEWTTDFVSWTNSLAWRVGTDGEVRFLAPANMPQCFFRLRQVDCSVLTTNDAPVPPPPPPPPIPKSGYA